MHTARSLTISPSMHCAGGYLVREAWSWGGAWSGGVVPDPGGSGPRGVPGPGGVGSQHALRQTPPSWTEFLTHSTEKNFPCGGNYLSFKAHSGNSVSSFLWSGHRLTSWFGKNRNIVNFMNFKIILICHSEQFLWYTKSYFQNNFITILVLKKNAFQ